jgi:AcrR family transcriptional regulator
MKNTVFENTASQDQQTRARLIQAAVELFSERGFKRVTVREICQAAGTNIAAVNYHFRDKFGLYTAVIQTAIDAMRSATEASMEAGKGRPAEEKLRAHIRVYLRHITDDGSASWIHQLMNHEMTDPTAALEMIFEQAIRPRVEYLSGIISELMGISASDERVFRCAASIQGQCLIYVYKPVRDRFIPGGQFSPAAIAKTADHIAEFSLAGIRRCRTRAKSGR